MFPYDGYTVIISALLAQVDERQKHEACISISIERDFENVHTAHTLPFLVKLNTITFLFIFEFSSVKYVLQNRQSNSHQSPCSMK